MAAIDVEHQSFICFEATSNQFHPSRLQANHVAEGRRRAKSIWREEVTYRRVEGGEVDMRMDRSAVGKDKMNKKKTINSIIKNGITVTFVNAQCCSEACSLVNPKRVHKPRKQRIRMRRGRGGGDSQSFGAHRDLTLPMLCVSAEYVHRARRLCLFY